MKVSVQTRDGDPFAVPLDPRRAFAWSSFQSVLDQLEREVKRRAGLTAAVAAAGSGISMLMRSLQLRLERDGAIVLLRAAQDGSIDEFIDALHAEILVRPAAPYTIALLIDDAHKLSDAALLEAATLADIKEGALAGMQLVLGGEPALESRLRGDLAIAARLASVLQLEPLGRDELGPYIAHRLTVAHRGPEPPPVGYEPFDRGALERLYAHSRGMLQTINLLCSAAMAGSPALIDARRIDRVAAVCAVLRQPKGQSSPAAPQPVLAKQAANGNVELFVKPTIRRSRRGIWLGAATAALGAAAAAVLFQDSIETLVTDTLTQRVAESGVSSPVTNSQTTPEPVAVAVAVNVDNAIWTSVRTDEVGEPIKVNVDTPDQSAEALQAIAPAAAPFPAAPITEPDEMTKLETMLAQTGVPSIVSSDPPPEPPNPIKETNIATSSPVAALPDDVGKPANVSSVTEPAAPAAPRRLNADLDKLVAQGQALMKGGDPVAARLFFERAATQGHAGAMRAMGQTHDPIELNRLGIIGINADPERALSWYRRGASAGDVESDGRFAALSEWLSVRNQKRR